MKRKNIFLRITAALLCMLFVIMGADVPVSAYDPGINVKIFVCDNKEKGIAGASVTITSTTNPAHTKTEITSADGSYVFNHADWPATEQYTITTYKAGYMTYTRAYTGTDGGPIAIVLTQGKSIIDIRITVVDDLNLPISNAYVGIQPPGEHPIYYYTNSNGIVELQYKMMVFPQSLFHITVFEFEGGNTIIRDDHASITPPGVINKTYTCKSKAKILTSSDGEVKIKGILPDGIEVSATPIDPKSDEYLKLKEAVCNPMKTVGHWKFIDNNWIFVFDISLKKDGQEIQPSSPVDVSIKVDSKYDGKKAVSAHLKPDGTTEVFQTRIKKDFNGQCYADIRSLTSCSPFMVIILDETWENSSSQSYNAPVYNPHAVFTVEYKDYKTVEYRQYQRIKELPVPQKEGYTFAGWHKDSQLTTEFKAGSRVTRNITLYPKWIKNNK